eukprot:2753771-Rhodomonas_salina.2
MLRVGRKFQRLWRMVWGFVLWVKGLLKENTTGRIAQGAVSHGEGLVYGGEEVVNSQQLSEDIVDTSGAATVNQGEGFVQSHDFSDHVQGLLGTQKLVVYSGESDPVQTPTVILSNTNHPSFWSPDLQHHTQLGEEVVHNTQLGEEVVSKGEEFTGTQLGEEVVHNTQLGEE